MSSQLILGIESSCDETAAAVVEAGYGVRSSVIYSQADEHAVFGGVVPEIAGRSHVREVHGVIQRALDEAGVVPSDLAGVAVTARPGLIGSLLVGLSAAKAIAFKWQLPLIPVHHIEAHVWAATMEEPDRELFPAVALVVSGGHTTLFRADGPGQLTSIATTLDDAAGEAFDKVAWMLGLAYPGGPSIAKLAESGDPAAFRFPRYRAKPPKNVPGGGPRALGFSFSGLKTSVLYHIRGQDALAPTPPADQIPRRADVAASFQEAVVDALTSQTVEAAQLEDLPRILVAGGVACNLRLREKLSAAAAKAGIDAHFPAPAYCTDNAVMIAGLGWPLLQAGATSGLELDASPR